MFPLRTERLVLRDFAPGDWEIIHQLSSDPRVRATQDFLPTNREADSHRWVEECIRHNEAEPRFAYNLAIERITENDPIGWIGWIGWGVATKPEIGDIDFRYALLPEFWKRGYMTEALVEALSYNFAHRHMNSVYGECAESNTVCRIDDYLTERTKSQ